VKLSGHANPKRRAPAPEWNEHLLAIPGQLGLQWLAHSAGTGMGAARLLVATLGLIASATAGHSQQIQTAPSTPARALGHTHDCSDYYPPIAARLSQSGTVLIQYDVKADGRLAHVVVVRSSGFWQLDHAALTCVSERWRDLPARRDGVAVVSPRHQALIQFKLIDSAPASRAPTMAAPLATPPATGLSDTGTRDALTFFIWALGPLAIVAWLVRWTRLYIFRRRDCPSCGARNRSIVPFVDAGYCSSCGVKFAPPA
jgi:TonB family protein